MADEVTLTSIKIEATVDTSKAEKSLKNLSGKLQRVQTAVKDGMTAAPKGTVSGEGVKNTVHWYTKLSNVFDKIGVKMKSVGYKTGSLEKALGKLKTRFVSISKSALSNTLTGIGNAMKGLSKYMVLSSTASAKLAANLAIAPWKRLAVSVRDIVKGLSGFLSALKRIAVYRAIRWALKEITKAFKEGIENLYQYSLLIEGQFAKSMDMLATSALYVKNSLAAMVAPIVNEVAPAIDFLADKFVDLLNTVNETVAAMTGAETWTKALKYPTSYAEAADDANSSAKKLRATLLGFDEINRLDDNRKGKRGSGSDALDYSKMFEEKQVTKNAKNFVKTLKDAFKSGDLRNIGESLGKNLLDGLNKIPWSEIERNVKRNASSVATLINGFIDVPNLGYTLGRSIANAFNVAVAKMNTFFSTVDWGKVGNFLASGVNGAIENFKIDELARNFALRINGIATLLKNFTKEVHWNNVASFLTEGITSAINQIKISDLTGAIADLFKKAIDTLGNVAGTVDWKKVGAWLASGINSAFNSFKSDPPIGKSIANIFNAAVTTIGSYVNEVKWDKIGSFLGDNITKFLQTFKIKDLGKTIAGVINKGVELIGGFVTSVDWSYVGTFLSNGINGFLNEVNAKNIGKTISKAIVGVITAAKDFLKKTDFEKFGEKIGEIISGLNWSAILSGIGEILMRAIWASLKTLKGVWDKSPAAALVLGTAIANLISTAIGLPKVTSMIATSLMTALSGGVTPAAGAVASGAVATGSSIPVMLVGVAAAAAWTIWKLRDVQESKNVGALEPYAGAIYDMEFDKEKYNQRMYNLSKGRDINTALTKSEAALAAMGAGQPNINISDLPTKNSTPVVDLPDPVNSLLNKWAAEEGQSGLYYLMKSVNTNTKNTADYCKDIKSYTKDTKTYVDSLKTTILANAGTMGSSGLIGKDTKNITAVKGYASGGTVATGSLFFAGEAGAEIVASQGSHTTVHNQDQIAESVAVGNEESNALLRELVSVGKSILAKDTTVVTPITTGDISSAMNRQNVREGRTVVPVAYGMGG